MRSLARDRAGAAVTTDGAGDQPRAFHLAQPGEARLHRDAGGWSGAWPGRGRRALAIGPVIWIFPCNGSILMHTDKEYTVRWRIHIDVSMSLAA
jgi:hypothetical protein